MNPMPHPLNTRRAAFSLLELAVVLGIISLIAGAGMSMASGALKTADRIATQEKLNTIKLALDSHAKTYGYLPCAADRALTPGNANFGMEMRLTPLPNQNCAATVGTSYINTGTLITGMVPVRSLGLPDSYASDSWGNKLTYSVVQPATNPTDYATSGGTMEVKYKGTAVYTLTNQQLTRNYTSAPDGLDASFTFSSSIPANTIVHFKSKVGATGYTGSYWVKTTGTTSKVTTDGPGTTTYLAYNATDAASTDPDGTVVLQSLGYAATYVVVSHGPDGRGAYPTESASIPATKACNDGVTGTPTSPPPCPLGTDTTCLDIHNCNDDVTYYDADYNDGSVAAQYFDDFIVWGSNSIYRAPVNTTVYTGASSNCPTNVCEPWCAGCEFNYPGAVSGATPLTPPTGLNDTNVPITLCKKVISSNATNCKASCFWSGKSTGATIAAGFYRCP